MKIGAELQHRIDIDGLRAVAVVPVVLAHAGLSVVAGGFIGVDVFFVISGFLITSILRRDMELGRYSLGHFYERRARRILPALIVMMAACFPFAWWLMLPDMLENFGQSVVATSLFSNNILLAITSGYWDLESNFKPLLHTWSLGVEEQFYVVFPLVLAMLWRFGARVQLSSILIFAAISMTLAEIGLRYFPLANFYLPTGRAWELMVGAACAYYPRREGKADEALSLLGLAAILLSVFLYDDTTPFPSVYAIVPVLGTALVLLFSHPGTICHRLLSIRPMVWIGLVSYSAYLWHQPLFAFARIYSLTPPSPLVMAALTVATFILAWLSWKYVEQPFRNRTAMPIRRVLAILLPSTIALIAAGYMLYKQQGYPERMFPNASQADIYITYNERIRKYSPKTFPDNGRENVLVGGNSQARDLANTLLEGDYLANRNFAYSEKLGACDTTDLASLPEAALFRSADLILITIHVPGPDCTGAKLEQLRRLTKADIIFVGPKNFGWNMNPLGRVAMADRGKTLVDALPFITQRNDLMARKLPRGTYLDLMRLLGPDGRRLPAFDAGGNPLSQDREHFTKYGAVFASKPVADEIERLRR